MAVLFFMPSAACTFRFFCSARVIGVRVRVSVFVYLSHVEVVTSFNLCLQFTDSRLASNLRNQLAPSKNLLRNLANQVLGR